jgi:hypothetical protein
LKYPRAINKGISSRGLYEYWVAGSIPVTGTAVTEEVLLEVVGPHRPLQTIGLQSGLESREYGRRDPSRWPRGTLYPLGTNFADMRRSLGRSLVFLIGLQRIVRGGSVEN